MYYGTETANLYRYLTTALGICTEHTLAYLALLFFVHRIVDEWGKVLVEVGNHTVPGLLAFGNLVKFFLDVGGEVIVKYLGEVHCEEVIDHGAYIGRHETCLLVAVLLVGLFVGQLAVL